MPPSTRSSRSFPSRSAPFALLVALTALACSSSVDDAGGTAGSSSVGGSCSASASTADVQCTYTHDALNSDPSVKANSTVTWTCSSSTRSMVSNGIPEHAVGTFPNTNCPNTIAAWSATASMPLTPALASSTTTSVHVVGFGLNGVKFDPSTAGTCTVSGGATSCSLIGNTGTWSIEAMGQTSFDFGVDDNNAHVQPTGEYHYHGMPTGLITDLGGTATKPLLVGFALDGFPVYARYGYTSSDDASSAVRVMTSSYQLKSTPDSGRPSTSTYPMGAFTQDYEYVAGSGDLDECNGRTDVTPDFRCGIYHYYITDTYPFIQRCLKGTATSTGEEGGGGTGGMGSMGTMSGMGDGGGGSTCASSSDCATGDVCCPSSLGCAGQCVPDCRDAGGCASGLSCDQTSGVCTP